MLCLSTLVGFLELGELLTNFSLREKVDVLGVQEVAASESELLALRRTALKCGYRMFCAAGSPTRGGWGAVRQRGGVALFVRLQFKIRPAFFVCWLGFSVRWCVAGRVVLGYCLCSAWLQ